jgi:hypothetical protein
MFVNFLHRSLYFCFFIFCIFLKRKCKMMDNSEKDNSITLPFLCILPLLKPIYYFIAFGLFPFNVLISDQSSSNSGQQAARWGL